MLKFFIRLGASDSWAIAIICQVSEDIVLKMVNILGCASEAGRAS
jgi:hypothetical protein